MPEASAWSIPTLDPSWACTPGDLPAHWHGWGEHTRARRAAGRGVHFYKYDYQFRAIYNDPSRLIQFNCPVCVEPNYSTNPGLPRALALGDVYRKRRLASLWGAAGIKILVDLNVDPAFHDLALLGVPRGWPSYATRKHRDVDWSWTDREFDLARRHSGLDAPPFVVFGGGTPARDRCSRSGWSWVPSHWRIRRNRFEADRDGQGTIGVDEADGAQGRRGG